MNLRKEREKRNWSIRDMAKALKCGHGTIQRWEQNGLPDDEITKHGVKAILINYPVNK